MFSDQIRVRSAVDIIFMLAGLLRTGWPWVPALDEQSCNGKGSLH